jgi:hypothetical protein
MPRCLAIQIEVGPEDLATRSWRGRGKFARWGGDYFAESPRGAERFPVWFPGAPQIGVGDFGERDQLDGVHLDQVPPQPYPRLQIGRDLPRRDPDGQRPARRSSAGCQPVLGASGSRPACRHPRGSAGAPAGTSCRHLRAGRATRCRAVGGAVTGAGLVLDAGPRLGDRVRHGRVHVLSGPFAAGLLRWLPRLPRGC